MKSGEKLYRASGQNNKTIYDYAMDYLFEKYDIRYDELGHDFQISFKNNNEWEILDANSILIELVQSNINITLAKVEILLRSHFIPKFNPIGEYFTSLPAWDGEDHIKSLATYLPMLEPDNFLYHLRKWLVRTVKGALEKNSFNKQCLVLVHSEQNSGKSTWCRFLCPPALSKYFAEDLTTDKDARIQLTRNFLINLDELSILAKKEINALKAYFSKTMINERLPYDRKNSTLQRTCSFIGSTNRTDFLNDETGSVRWLCFELAGKINFGYSKDVQIDKVWAQAFHLAYMDDNFNPELTISDIIKNEERNKTYRESSMEEEMLCKYFISSDDPSDFLTASDIVIRLSCINVRLNIYSMGRALKARNFKRVKEPSRQVYGYLVKPLFLSSPLELGN